MTGAASRERRKPALRAGADASVAGIRPSGMEFDSELVDVLHSMRDQPYPGPAAGSDPPALLRWLRTTPALQSWVSLQGPAVTGHVQVSNPGVMPAGIAAALSGIQPLEVARLFVRPSARGAGAGEALLDCATRWVQAQGAAPTLRVSDYLDDAIRLYRRSGWIEVGAVTSSLTGDRLLLFTLPWQEPGSRTRI